AAEALQRIVEILLAVDVLGRDGALRRLVGRERLRLGLVVVAGDRPGDELVQRQLIVGRQRDADNAERGAAQRIGVLAAGGLLVDRPEASQRVELVCERNRDRDRV